MVSIKSQPFIATHIRKGKFWAGSGATAPSQHPTSPLTTNNVAKLEVVCFDLNLVWNLGFKHINL